MNIDHNFEVMIQQADVSRLGANAATKGVIKATDGCIPIFHKRDSLDERASEEQGRPIYRSEDWLEIISPGSKDRPLRPASPADKVKYAEQWESYKRGDAREIADGTPITEWQGIPRARAMELRALGIYTVEQLAQAPDTALARIGMESRALQNAARKFVSDETDLSLERKLRAEADARAAEQQATIEELTRRLAALEAGNAANRTADSTSGRARGRD
jgi:hypothetical protein